MMNKRAVVAILLLADTIGAAIISLCSIYLVTGQMHARLLGEYLPVIVLVLVSTYIILFLLGLYRSTWRYAGVFECMATGLAAVCVLAVGLMGCIVRSLTVRFAFCYAILFFCLTMATRFFARFVRQLRSEHSLSHGNGKRVIIVGAGDAGRMLLREIRNSAYMDYYPVCFLDDDRNKIGLAIDGVPIYGPVGRIRAAVARYRAECVLVAMPSVPRAVLRDVLEKCRSSGLRIQTLPGLYQLANGEVQISALRDVEIEDLLGREQICVNLNEIMGYIEGKVVLITGGGGSIGSELCRQIATHRPKRLVLLDIYENSLYDIEQELHRRHPDLMVEALIASVRDVGKMEQVFGKYRPSIVFNAAAHKHVPLMETSPNEAVKNNVFGTLNVARMADRYDVSRFVQISTDKAVRPTNIMGATKRLCEMIIQTYARHSRTEFVAVRFGNVLGSNGSVIPLFRQQIREGGPVTVTHRDITRYFMTIPEAVSLVLQAGAYAKGGEIFVLDMGEPVRIYNLAENLIRLSGLEPGVDIEIKCTGLRPGEKLYEERLMEEEGLQTTPSGLISIAKPIAVDEDKLFAGLDELYKAAYSESTNIKELMAELVDTYHAAKQE